MPRILGPGAAGDIDHPDDATAPSVTAAGGATSRAFMALQTVDADLPWAASHGATHAAVVAYWDRQQQTLGGAVDCTDVVASIAAAEAAGLKVSLEVALQYPPDFVTACDGFVDQDGVEWEGAQGSGDEVFDWVWGGTARRMVADYLGKLLPQIPWAKVDRVRLGGGQKGELQFPGDGSIRWMGFSHAAQTGEDIAANMEVCPVPGHVPSATPAWTSDDAEFNDWYQESLAVWMRWLTLQYRNAGFGGPIYVMHPGAGIRPLSQTPTSAEQGDNFRINASRGLDWDRQIHRYYDWKVRPHCTWMDHDHFVTSDPFSSVHDGNAAPWYHLARTAAKYGVTELWGENTGGQVDADMDRVFETGAIHNGYRGMAWLSHQSLLTGDGDTYANFKRNIEGLS